MIPKLIHKTILQFHIYDEKNQRNFSLRKSKLNLKFEFLNEYKPVLQIFDPNQKFKKVFFNRFREDHIACIAYLDKRPVHIAWIAFNQLWIDESKWLLRLTSSACCIYNVETLPQFRRQGIYSEVLLFIADYWLNKKGKAVLIYSDIKNQSSIHGIVNAGFRQFGEIRCLIAFNEFVLSRSMDLQFGNLYGTIA